ncbi:hypothetical protein M8S10_13700 [Enterobacter chuandaensis]|uniref:hypothetical protein n=1 Tax=Enterobacter chuandaensis TaxID=2497875 RepID=UPI002074DFD7|nr:hypothetical protein [Enterobacter chuandaensis]MCM7589861.1 hypothetical protein [Enterobacter chuandaensis]
MTSFIKSRFLSLTLFAVLSSISLYFFLVSHPTVIMSGDDWGNLTSTRAFYPQWGIANPIKVMPELGYPLFARLSTFLIMPLGFGFLESFSIITAIFITILLSLFLHQLFLLFNATLSSGFIRSSIFVVFFYALIFFIFLKDGNHENLYMLWEVNITCFYHYIAPALINSALAIYVIRNYRHLDLNSIKRKGFLRSSSIFFCSYIAVFSSLFANIILAVACGVCLLLSLINNSFSFAKTLKDNLLQAFTLTAWVVSVIFEANGGRAASLGSGSLDIVGSLGVFKYLVEQVQSALLYPAVALISIGFITSLYSLIKSKNTDKGIILFIVVTSGLLTFIALILLCARAGSYYAARPVVMWGTFLYSSLAVFITIDIFTNYYKKLINTLLAFLAFSLVYQGLTSDSTLKQSINLNLSYIQAKAVSQNIIDNVVSTDLKNGTSMILYVPKGDDNDNWPFPIYEGPFIGRALKTYGIIKNEIYIEVKPDVSLNKKMSVPLN